MSGLFVGAGALALVAAALFVVPAWRRGRRVDAISAASAVFVVALGIVTYQSLGAPELASGVAASADPGERGMPPLDDAVSGLIERLQANPEDIEGWVLLGRSFVQMGRFAEAARAYGEARARTPVPDDELDLAYAESRILADQTTLAGAAGEIADRLAKAHPDDVRAQLYGGLAAMAKGEDALARTRFERILALDVPDDLRGVVETRLTQLDGTPTASTAAARGDAEASGAGDPAEAPDTTLQTRVRVRVAVGETVAAEALAGAKALFLFARAPEGGPPVAVQRHPPSSLPGTFELSDADAMIPSRRLSNYDQVRLVARLSMSGNPIAASGDVFSEATIAPGSDTEVELVLDRMEP